MVKTYALLFVLLWTSFLQGQNNDTIPKNELGIFIETAPEFKGCLTEFIADNIDYPETALTDSAGGTVIISYWIDIDGSTFNHKIERGVRKDLNNEALRVSKLICYNKPAMQKGKPIKVRYVVPVKFNLPDSISKIVCNIKENVSSQNDKTTQDDHFEIITCVESSPEFKKKDLNALTIFFVENVREIDVPEDATIILVQFLVDTLGYTSKHEVIRGFNAELDDEALRICRLLKFERPALQRGKPVNYIFTVGFNFKDLLDKKAEVKKKRERKKRK